MDNSQENVAGNDVAQAAEVVEVVEAADAMPEQPAAPRPVPDRAQIKCILEGAVLAAGETLNIDRFASLFDVHERPSPETIRELLGEIAEEYAGRGIELKEVASGFRIQVRKEFGPWVSRLWTEKPPRYSRALLETMALIAYRQPITRGEIEEIRGVTVSSEMIKSLLERDWVRVVGHRDVPGRPALYATTHDFLDYFDLKSLEEMPTLSEIRDLDKVNPELQLEMGADAQAGATAEMTLAEPQYIIGEAEEDDLADIHMDIQQVDEVLKRVEDSFRRKEEAPVEVTPVSDDADAAAGQPADGSVRDGSS